MQKTDLEQTAAALAENDRFVVTTHENPDGDALGSLLATTLTLRPLGKSADMYLHGSVPLPNEYEFMALDDLIRAARAGRGRTGARGGRLRQREPPRAGAGADPRARPNSS